ncbi:MAG: transcriptional repressor [Chloroflexi bacterium]|nr:transcriptional repressor [Chloroflexota bacterium]
MSCSRDSDQAIRSAGLRRTVSRSVVSSTLRHHRGHHTVEEIEALAQQEFPAASGIAKSSLYRALEALEGAGLVVAVRGAQEEARFEWSGDEGSHHHLVCDRCGATQEVALESARAVEREAKRAFGFATRVQHLALRGLCEGCAAREGERERATR